MNLTVPVLGTAHDAATFRLAELTSADLFVCAYTDGMFGYSTATIRSIHDAGKGVFCNHERGVTDLAGGYGAGTLAASQALAVVRGQWGAPRDGTVAIAYSVDASVAVASFAIYVPAFQAIRAYHGSEYLIGFYGELALYKYLKARGLVDVKCWLSASSSFPGYDPNDSDVGLVQLVGTDIAGTDRDLITNLDLGVWWPAGHDPSGGGTVIAPPVPPEEDDMQQVAIYVWVANPDGSKLRTYLLDPLGRWKWWIPDPPTDAVIAMNVGDGKLYAMGGPVYLAYIDAVPSYPLTDVIDIAEVSVGQIAAPSYTGTVTLGGVTANIDLNPKAAS